MRIAALVLGAACAGGAAAAQDVDLFSFASGGVGGGYYESASAICNVVNEKSDDDIYCSPEPTSGSLYNLEALSEGEVEFALVQSDWHAFAYEGRDLFQGVGPMKGLRSVMSLYPESVTILASKASEIRSAAELVGKRVDIGHPSSGRNASLRRLLDAMAMSSSDFAVLSELTDSAAIDELCAGNLDAVALIVGHPNSVVRRALATCDIHVVPFTGPRIDAIFGPSTDYVSAVIPAAAYSQLPTDVATYAVMATVVTRADVDPRLVRAMVEGTLDSLGELAAAAPILRDLVPSAMSVDGLVAPLHKAAAAAFESYLRGQQ